MRRDEILQAIGIGCAMLSLGVTFMASVRLHILWSLESAAIPFAVLFVASLVLIVGGAAIKPIALVASYVSMGSCAAVAIVDRLHQVIYGVGFIVFFVLFSIVASVALAREQHRSRR